MAVYHITKLADGTAELVHPDGRTTTHASTTEAVQTVPRGNQYALNNEPAAAVLPHSVVLQPVDGQWQVRYDRADGARYAEFYEDKPTALTRAQSLSN